MIEEYLKQNPDLAPKVGDGLPVEGRRQALAARPQDRRRQRQAGRRRGRVHARARRGRLPRPDAGQGRPDEAVHDRQAEDQRQRDGVAEAAVPVARSIRARRSRSIDEARGACGGGAPAAAGGGARGAKPPAAHAPAFFAALDEAPRRRTRSSRTRCARRSTFKVIDRTRRRRSSSAATAARSTRLTIADADLPALAAGNVEVALSTRQAAHRWRRLRRARLGFLKGLI